MEELIKKKGRLQKQQKQKFAKSSGTLAGQFSRSKTANGYIKTIKSKVSVKIK